MESFRKFNRLEISEKKEDVKFSCGVIRSIIILLFIIVCMIEIFSQRRKWKFYIIVRVPFILKCAFRALKILLQFNSVII